MTEELKELPITHLPMSAGMMAAIIIGSLAAGSLFVGCIAHLLLTRGWKGQSHSSLVVRKEAMLVHNPLDDTHREAGGPPSHNAGDQNIYEVMASPTFLVSPPW
ncbi:carcinoembryonic antigen-related cell adhesion molecule 19 [Neovison vison]|uniref:carcinoembryonic antigen-related cell adhesion molecule 19 n=1 Tax=Neovison vison TaxID=452646 RepID=UPI001CEFDC8C|nr:carcinoembryonic antigen-related cell adhesion molecule 19 [Neogale vison]